MISALRALLYFSIRATIRGVCSRLRNHNIDTTLGNQSYTATHYLTVACVRTRRKEKNLNQRLDKADEGEWQAGSRPIIDAISRSSSNTRNLFLSPNRNFNDSRFFSCFSSNIINSYYHHCRKVLFLKKFNFFGAEVANAGEWERARHVRQIFFLFNFDFLLRLLPTKTVFFLHEKSEKVPKLILKEFREAKRRHDVMMTALRRGTGAAHTLEHARTRSFK